MRKRTSKRAARAPHVERFKVDAALLKVTPPPKSGKTPEK